MKLHVASRGGGGVTINLAFPAGGYVKTVTIKSLKIFLARSFFLYKPTSYI